VTYGLPGGRSRVSNAFIATMHSGYRGVFARVPGAGRRGPKPDRSQLPIVELYGPSIGHVFKKYRPAGLARTREAFETAFEHELNRLTSQTPSGWAE
jgi:copper oxidase (laccase) domain-containing protein